MSGRQLLRRAVVGAAPVLALAAAAPAQAAPIAGCPTTTPGVNTCFKAVTTGGSLSIRSLRVSLNRPLTITGGFQGGTGWADIQGAQLSGAPLSVPGGLIGLSRHRAAAARHHEHHRVDAARRHPADQPSRGSCSARPRSSCRSRSSWATSCSAVAASSGRRRARSGSCSPPVGDSAPRDSWPTAASRRAAPRSRTPRSPCPPPPAAARAASASCSRS